MWDSSIIHALSWIFMKKYETFKVHPFPGSDMRFKYYSCAFMNFHEKISKFQISPFSRFKCEIKVLFMRFHEFSWKKNFQSSFFPSSDVIFKYYLCIFMNFREKISNFQSSFFSKFRCEIQVLFMRFHEFSWKNIKLSKFVLFPVQMRDSSIIHALS
jgi:hypothetical protein